MWRLTRFNVNANVVHGYFMGLAIPAGGNLVAMSAWLFLSLGINPADYGLLYPAAVAVTGYLMVSHVHYPDFKGGGERIYVVSKLVALIVFAGILYVGRTAALPAVFTAIFAAYAFFGIVNHVTALTMRTRES